MHLTFKKLKLSRRRTNTSRILYVVIVILLLFKVFYYETLKISIDKNSPADELVKEASSSIDPSLPYSEYRRIQDSIRREIEEDQFTTRGWKGFLSLGLERLKHRQQEKHCLTVSGYYRTGPIKEKTSLHLTQKDDQEWQIGFPLSPNAFKIWSVIVIAFMVLIGIIAFYAFLYIPIRLLLLISRGRAFTDEAIGGFYIISGALIFCGVLQILIRLGFHIYYKALLPPSLTFYYYEDLMSGWVGIFAGFVVLLIAEAFKRGYQLQEEQQLTV